jgi:predicted SAM-dependent methyltransferase
VDKQSRKINLGCGGHYYDDYINVDRDPKQRSDIQADVSNLSGLGEARFDFVLASHILEHFPPVQTQAVLEEWYRITEDGGLVEIRIPDLYILTRDYLEGKAPIDDYFRPSDEKEHPRDTKAIDEIAKLYMNGDVTADEFATVIFKERIDIDRHVWAFDSKSIVVALEEAGFVGIAIMPKSRPMQPDPADRPRTFENCLVVQARKPAKKKLKVALCMHELWEAPFDGYCSVSKIMNALIPFMIQDGIEPHIFSKQDKYPEYSFIGGVHYHRHEFEDAIQFTQWVGETCDRLGIDIVEIYNRAWYVPTNAKRVIHMDNDHIREHHTRELSSADKVILISDYLHTMTVDKMPEYQGKYILNKLGVNLDLYHPGPKEDQRGLSYTAMVGADR